MLRWYSRSCRVGGGWPGTAPPAVRDPVPEGHPGRGGPVLGRAADGQQRGVQGPAGVGLGDGLTAARAGGVGAGRVEGEPGRHPGAAPAGRAAVPGGGVRERRDQGRAGGVQHVPVPGVSLALARLHVDLHRGGQAHHRVGGLGPGREVRLHGQVAGMVEDPGGGAGRPDADPGQVDPLAPGGFAQGAQVAGGLFDRFGQAARGRGAELHLPAGFTGQPALDRGVVQGVPQGRVPLRRQRRVRVAEVDGMQFQLDAEASWRAGLEAGARDPGLGRRCPEQCRRGVGLIVVGRHLRSPFPRAVRRSTSAPYLPLSATASPRRVTAR